QVFRPSGWSLSKAMACRTERGTRRDVGKIEPSRIPQDISEIAPEVLQTWVRLAADAVHRKKASIPFLARVVNKIWIHEQDLISIHEILPRIIPVHLWRIVPHAKVTVVAVIDIDFERRLTGPARLSWRDPGGRGDPVRIGVVDDRIFIVLKHAIADGVLMVLPPFVASDERNQMIIPPG